MKDHQDLLLEFAYFLPDHALATTSVSEEPVLNMGHFTSDRGTVIINNRENSVDRALSESALEFEVNDDYGMVPAEQSSVKKMLEIVTMELGDEKYCIICLEGLEVGSDASRMPCSHTFHDHCVEKWLKQSHCCPICRFEMPKEKEQ